MTETTEREINRRHMSVSDEVAVQITQMNKWFGTFHVLRDINLTVYRGDRIRSMFLMSDDNSVPSTMIRPV